MTTWLILGSVTVYNCVWDQSVRLRRSLIYKQRLKRSWAVIVWLILTQLPTLQFRCCNSVEDFSLADDSTPDSIRRKIKNKKILTHGFIKLKIMMTVLNQNRLEGGKKGKWLILLCAHLDKPYLVHSNTSCFPGGWISAGVSWDCQDLPIGVMRPKSTLTQSKWGVTGRSICAGCCLWPQGPRNRPTDWLTDRLHRGSEARPMEQSPAKCVHYTTERRTMNTMNIKETQKDWTLHTKIIIIFVWAAYEID